MEAEIHQLRDSLQMSETARGQLERDLHSVRAQLESEASARRILDERNTDLSAEAGNKGEELARALAEATEQARTAERLRQELAQVQEEFEAVMKAWPAKFRQRYERKKHESPTLLSVETMGSKDERGLVHAFFN